MTVSEFGPFRVSVRLAGDSQLSEEDVRAAIAQALAQLFEVPVYDPARPQGHRPYPGITVTVQRSG